MIWAELDFGTHFWALFGALQVGVVNSKGSQNAIFWNILKYLNILSKSFISQNFTALRKVVQLSSVCSMKIAQNEWPWWVPFGKYWRGVNFGHQNLSPAPQIQYILIKKVNYSFRKAFISFLLVGFLFSLAPSICLLLSTVWASRDPFWDFALLSAEGSQLWNVKNPRDFQISEICPGPLAVLALGGSPLAFLALWRSQPFGVPSPLAFTAL